MDEFIDAQTQLLANVQGEEQMKLEKSRLLKIDEARSERRVRLLMQESFFDPHDEAINDLFMLIEAQIAQSKSTCM